jgi:hypothetical protein
MTEPEEPSNGRDDESDDEPIRITPGLVVLGLLAIALGVFSALIMSASTFGR